MTLSPRMRLAGWIGIGVLSGGLITGIAIGSATAASPSPTPRPYGYGQPGPRMPPLGPMHRFGERPGAGLGPLDGDVLHGEATVKLPDGSTEVVVRQSGDITDITDTTINVTSSDGFEASYAVDKFTRISLDGADGALSSLKKGDTVHVGGTKKGSTNHADSVFEGTGMEHRVR
jgi:hypothetical protein